MSPGKESAPDTVEVASSTADVVDTREYGKLDLRAIKVNFILIEKVIIFH